MGVVKKIIFSFSITVALLVLPLMFARKLFRDDIFIPASALAEHISSYNAWDNFVWAIESVRDSEFQYIIGVDGLDPFFSDSWVMETLAELGNFLAKILKPFIVVVNIIIAFFAFIIDSAVWVYDFIILICTADFNFLVYLFP